MVGELPKVENNMMYQGHTCTPEDIVLPYNEGNLILSWKPKVNVPVFATKVDIVYGSSMSWKPKVNQPTGICH